MILVKMVKALILGIMFFSYFFSMMSKHPLTLGFTVIFQASLMAFVMSIEMKFSWYSFLIFMIYLGGILMLFSYIISITFSTEKMLVNKNLLLYTMLTALLMPFLYKSNEENFLIVMNKEFSKVLEPAFSEFWKITIFMVLFLLLIMIFVVFMTENVKKNVKPKF